jgi:hypothetical protein
MLRAQEREQRMADLSIAQTNWVIDGATLTKRYRYVGILGESSEHIIQIDIDTSQNAVLGGLPRPCLFPDRA